MEAEYLSCFAAQTRVLRLTHLAYVDELLSILHRESNQLTDVKLIMRSTFRSPDVRIPELLRGWEQSVRDIWDGRGLRFTLELDESVHVRRILLFNPVNTVEINLELGILIHLDDSVNMGRAIQPRRTICCEAMVYNHTGRWEGPPSPGNCTGAAGGPASRKRRCEDQWQALLDHGLQEFSSRFGVQALRDGCHIVVPNDPLSREADAALRDLAAWYAPHVSLFAQASQELVDAIKQR